MTDSTFSSSDQPVDPRKIEFYWTEQGLARQESDCGRYAAQLINTTCARLVLNGRAEPNVRRHDTVLEQVHVGLDESLHPSRSLCEHLEDMTIHRQHDLED